MTRPCLGINGGYCGSEEIRLFNDRRSFYGGHSTLLEALRAGFLDETVNELHIGVCRVITADDMLFDRDTEDLLDSMQETSIELCGEVAETWIPKVPSFVGTSPGTPEREAAEKQLFEYKSTLSNLTKRIRRVVSDWMKETGFEPDFYMADEVRVFSRDLFVEMAKQEVPFKVGDFVHYTPEHDSDQFENGRIKSISPFYIFVVYNCAEDWENYHNYTASATKVANLKPGWKEK